MSSPFDAKHAAVVAKIYSYADRYGIDRAIAVWQIWQESRFNPAAKSHAGASGIAQFMPATASRFGVNVWDIDSSLNGWGKYMSWLLKQSYINGNISLALAGYNAGEGNVKKYKGIPPFKETQNYVATITGNAGTSGSGSSVFAGAGQMPSLFNFGFDIPEISTTQAVLGLLIIYLILD